MGFWQGLWVFVGLHGLLGIDENTKETYRNDGLSFGKFNAAD